MKIKFPVRLSALCLLISFAPLPAMAAEYGAVHTGDQSHMGLWIGIAVAAVVAMIVVAVIAHRGKSKIGGKRLKKK